MNATGEPSAVVCHSEHTCDYTFLMITQTQTLAYMHVFTATKEYIFN